jgi:SMODS and SLOG-associating 2TM effector domain 1
MSAYWVWLAPVIALAITLAGIQAAVALTAVIRTRDYRRFEDRSRERLARQLPLPTVDRMPVEELRRAFSPALDKLHQIANSTQTAYHNAVVRSAAALAVAFVGLVLGTTPQHDWLPKVVGLFANHQVVEYVLTWLDAIAIVSVLVLFVYARGVSRRWIVSRVEAELLRQYQYLNVVFTHPETSTPHNETKTRFDLEIDAVREQVQRDQTADIISRIDRFWSRRRATIESSAATSGMTVDGLLVYLQRRVLRQLCWFADSEARLEHIAERRAATLVVLYVIAAIVALLKLLLALGGGHAPQYFIPLLLILTGMSAAMTAYYINQNARSLSHRYRTQQRRIAAWLKAFDDRWKISTLPSLTLDAVTKTEISRHLLEFEDLMIEELIDWVHITSSDGIELAP